MSQLIKVISTVVPIVYKHRKAIYAVLTAQDRYISKSFRYGGYGKATSYGVRSGALAGSVLGAFINNAEDSPGNAVPTKVQPKYTTGPPNKARIRRTGRNNSRFSDFNQYNKKCRCPNPSKY